MKRIANKMVCILTVFTIIGFSAYAFAGGKTGYGRHHGGWHHGGNECPGYGFMAGDLNEEDIQKLDEQREAFFKSTEDLRQERYQKRLTMESEFAKKNPDPKKVANLQKEISDLTAKIDQKRIEHMIEMKKINPGFGTGFMGPGMMGHGYGRGHRGGGHMMGYGASPDRPCWQ